MIDVKREAGRRTKPQIPVPQILLSGEIAEGWELKHPILLDLKIGEAGEHIVSYEAFDTYGVGRTAQEAVEDFATMLIDLYEELAQSPEVLSAYYQNLFDRLRAALSPL